jgi:CRP/FNR family transcriptional regulator, cyclic AMP receptor protein
MTHVAEAVGYLASLLVFLTFYTKTMVPLRIVGICSNFAFIAYGYLGGLYPVLILHLILLPLNGWRLRQMLRLTKQVHEAARTDLKMDWLRPFTSTRRINAGDVLFRKGEPANAMFFVVSGRYRLTELGLDILPGHVVGELALLALDQARTQSLECVESGEVLQITYDQVKQLYYQNPQFGFYFIQLTTRRLFQNIARLESELGTCKIASAPTTTG